MPAYNFVGMHGEGGGGGGGSQTNPALTRHTKCFITYAALTVRAVQEWMQDFQIEGVPQPHL